MKMAPETYDRLDSRFGVIGAFWMPGASEHMAGRLTADRRDITFATAPKYARVTDSLAEYSNLFAEGVHERIPVLHGFTQHGRCTLCDPVEIARPGLTHHGLGQSIRSVTYRASLCITGMHVGGSQDKCLNSARYTFTGLSDWLPKATTTKWEKENITLTIPLKDRDIIDLWVPETEIRVKVKVFSEFVGSLGDGARLSRSVAFVDVENPEPESVSWYLKIGSRL